MNYFGNLDGLEFRTYSFEIPVDSMPVELLVQAPGAGSRDFVLLPEQSSISKFSKDCTLFFSKGLGAHYQYVGGELTSLVLATEGEQPNIAGKMEFVIARWAKKSNTPFPCQIRLTTKDLSLDRNLKYVEVHSASPQDPSGEK